MKDTLLDLVSHTLPVGIEVAKYVVEDDTVKIFGITDDQATLLQARTHKPVEGFDGTFGIPNLSKLSSLLNLEPYKDGGKLTLESNNDGVPSNVHFENADGDFKNDHRFMTTATINERVKSAELKRAPSWDVELVPEGTSVMRFGWQAGITDDEVFAVRTDDGNLLFQFGDQSTHRGEFVFASGVEGKMKGHCLWFINRVLPILKLDGDISMSFDDAGLLKITVDSGLAVYDYYLPATTR